MDKDHEAFEMMLEENIQETRKQFTLFKMRFPLSLLRTPLKSLKTYRDEVGVAVLYFSLKLLH